MDKTTTAIRLEQWANIFQEWSVSELNKTEFCRQCGIGNSEETGHRGSAASVYPFR